MLLHSTTRLSLFTLSLITIANVTLLCGSSAIAGPIFFSLNAVTPTDADGLDPEVVLEGNTSGSLRYTDGGVDSVTALLSTGSAATFNVVGNGGVGTTIGGNTAWNPTGDLLEVTFDKAVIVESISWNGGIGNAFFEEFITVGAGTTQTQTGNQPEVVAVTDNSVLAIGDKLVIYAGDTASTIDTEVNHRLLGFTVSLAPSSAVPEPSTLALATLGLLSLSFVGWRRRRR